MSNHDRWSELCQRVAKDDGHLIRRAGPWTEDKVYLSNRYIEITTQGMKNAWKDGLAYIDLFAGPGICLNEESGKRFPGSPLLAAWAPVPFRNIVVIEQEQTVADACRARLASSGTTSPYEVINGDCNAKIQEAVAQLPPGVLTLAFIDPEGLQVRFETLASLARSRRVDLLILFPVGYDIVRNIRLYEIQDVSKLDRALGFGSKWRDNWQEVLNRDAAKVIEFITGEYTARLKTELGYEVLRDVAVIHRGKVFYKLVYASMHERGLDFWEKALRKERGGQMGLGF